MTDLSTAEQQRVYVLIAEAVYDHGVVGVYPSEELARAAAEAIWPQTDGHHRLRIEAVEFGKTYEGVFPYTFLDDVNRDDPPGAPKIEVVDKLKGAA